jgi:hypothetical protein
MGIYANGHSVPTRTNIFKGVPHGFRRYGDQLSVSKKWDEVMVDGILWALQEPLSGSSSIQEFW